MPQMNLFTKQKQTHRHREQVFATGEVAGIMRQKDEGDQEMQISGYKMNESQLWHVWCGTCHKENNYVLFLW